MSVILLGIDGSGQRINRRYDQHFSNSFVRRLCFTGSGNRLYLRGPGTAGLDLVSAINQGFEFIKRAKRQSSTSKILLTGFSRGATGVVVVAKKLKKYGLNVDAMMLFDCVDRHLRVDASKIPNNVMNVKHVIRDPRSGSRRRFGNDGMRWDPNSTNYLPIMKFMCTHGGMGGTPHNHLDDNKALTDFIDEGWLTRRTNITYQQDRDVSERVWNSCRDYFHLHGFN